MKDPALELVEIHKLLPAFRQKFLGQPVKNKKWWGRQIVSLLDGEIHPNHGDVEFLAMPHDIVLSDALLLDHFSGEVFTGEHFCQNQKCKQWHDHRMTCIGTHGQFEHNRVKWYCADLDTNESVSAALNHFCPVLTKHNIEYIWEYGGPNFNKAHLWFFCNTNNALLTKFVEALWAESGSDPWELKIEEYPTRKPNNLIRTPGGKHQRSGQIMPVEFRGKIYKGARNIIKCIIACKPVNEAYMAKVIGDAFQLGDTAADPKNILSGLDRSRIKRNFTTSSIREKKAKTYKYLPLNLPHFCKDAPPIFLKLANECPAINKLVNDSEPEERGGKLILEDTGDPIHRWGLYAHNIFDADLWRLQQYDPNNLEVYRDYPQQWFDEHRLRDPSGHNWDYEGDSRFKMKIPDCKTWNRDFKLCGGCPHAGRTGFKSPVDLFYNAEPIQIESGELIQTGTNEEIAKETQKLADDLIYEARTKNKKLDLTVRSVQGTFKSTFVSQRAYRYGRAGVKVMIAVSAGRLAMEMAERIETRGLDVFVVMSHKNLFKYWMPKQPAEEQFECPDHQEIQEWIELGVSKRAITTNYCNGCEYRRQCPFPKQYTQAVESDANVVIVQQAHFRAKQAMNILLKKNFEMLFIDETFIDSTYTYVKLKKIEIHFLKRLAKKHQWAKDLYAWVKGKVPKDKIQLNVRALTVLKQIYDKRKIPWNLPVCIDHYNRGQMYMKDVGMFYFNPVPDIPIRVLTDATAPMDYIRIVLNTKRMKSVGASRVTDVTLYNPNNQMIKVIDGSTSRGSLQDLERYQKDLHFIGYKAKTEYKLLTILVTVYDSDVKKVREFFEQYYPNEVNRITVASMAVGTNEWRDINVQFQLCGVHFNLKTLKEIEWRINNIANYWNLIDGEPEIENTYPHLVTEGTTSRFDEEVIVPVEVKMLDPKARRKRLPRRVKFLNVRLKRPRKLGEEIAYYLSLGKTQQGRRIRVYWKDLDVPDIEAAKKLYSPLAVFRIHNGKVQVSDVKKFYNFSKRYEPGSLYTDVVLHDSLWAVADLNNKE